MSLRDEIAEQPRVVQRLLDEGWPEARTLGRALAAVEHITIVARGSSDNAATYGKDLLESVAGVVTALAAPSLVTRYGAPPSYARGAVIGISQSGASPDVAGVVAEGRRVGAVTIAFTNRPRSKLGGAAEPLAMPCAAHAAVPPPAKLTVSVGTTPAGDPTPFTIRVTGPACNGTPTDVSFTLVGGQSKVLDLCDSPPDLAHRFLLSEP